MFSSQLTEEYRGFIIKYDPPPIPTQSHDWSYTHKDYDGPEDNRHGTAGSVEDCKAAIDSYIEESVQHCKDQINTHFGNVE